MFRLAQVKLFVPKNKSVLLKTSPPKTWAPAADPAGCQYAKAMGLKVCAIDFGPEKKSYAIETLGCDAYVDIKDKKGLG